MSFRLDHIAIGVRSIEACAPWVERALGGVRREGGPSPGFDWAQWAFANDARLELIEPTGAPGFLHRFLARQGAGVHHVTFKVPDLRAAAARARAAGYEIVGYDDTSLPGWKECFLHPKQAQGIVVQFAETSYTSADHSPRARADAVRLLGLRLRALAEDQARAQWERLLGGAAEPAGAGCVRFTWPDSPMGITVEVDGRAERAEPGPVAVEFSGTPALTMTADVAASFGTPMEIR